MAGTTFGSIVIQAANQAGDVTRLEALAAAIVTPGELAELTAAGAIQAHSAADGTLEQGKIFILENQTPDSETAFSINVDYASGDTVYYAQGKAGDVFYGWLAAGENAAITSSLGSDGAGALKVVTVGVGTLANSVVGSPVVAVDNSGGGTRVRIQVRVV